MSGGRLHTRTLPPSPSPPPPEVIMCALGQPLPTADDSYYPDIKDDPDADMEDVGPSHVGGRGLSSLQTLFTATAIICRPYSPTCLRVRMCVRTYVCTCIQ